MKVKYSLRTFNGGVLSIVIFICFLFSIILSSLIIFFYYNKIYLDNFYLKERLLRNARSGINYCISYFDDLDKNKLNMIDLYNDRKDSVSLNVMNWGLYKIVSSRSIINNQSYKLSAMIGEMPIDTNMSLYVSDHGEPISISGKVKLSGNSYLPKTGLRIAYIGNEPASFDINSKQIRNSNQNLPPLIDEVKNNINLTFNISELTNSIGSEIPDSTYQSFNETTIIYYSSSSIDLTGKKLLGNIKIYSENEIIISSSTQLESVIVCANTIRVNNGFKGSLQAFALDSIYIGDDCLFSYPSALILKQNPNKDSRMHIGNSEISGVVLTYNDFQSNNRCILEMTAGTIIQGQVYASDIANLQGHIYGNAYCNETSNISSFAVYRNQISNIEIDIYKRSKFYNGVNLINSAKHSIPGIMQWL